jgi:hypothetical protein
MATHKRQHRRRAEQAIERAGKSIDEFCAAYGFSRSTYNNYRKHDVGPAETRMVAHGRVIITPESEAAWKLRHTAPAETITAAE